MERSRGSTPESNEVVETIHTGGSPRGVAVAAELVWVTIEARAIPGDLAAGNARETAHLVALSDAGSLDPALAVDPLSLQLEYATCAKLFNYPDKPPPAGMQVEPEVALSPPAVSADGRTYTFTIRPGFRFSPPSNEAVTARDLQVHDRAEPESEDRRPCARKPRRDRRRRSLRGGQGDRHRRRGRERQQADDQADPSPRPT